MFDQILVHVSDIDDAARYYEGFTFIPSIAAHFCKTGRSTGAADAAHCEGKGLNSYGPTFEVVLYDANYNIIPIIFGHFVGAECLEYWKVIFEQCFFGRPT